MKRVPFKSPLTPLYPKDVLTAYSELGIEDSFLYPEEEACIAKAAPKRRREFATGRFLARAALAEAGIAPAPLVPGPDRAPIWPTGIVGSISHTDDCCGAAVAARGKIMGIGLDIESAEPLDERLWCLLITDPERSWLQKRNPTERSHLAKLIFSAKECLFKCQFPIVRRWLEFTDVAINLHLESGVFTVNIHPSVERVEPDCEGLTGRFLFADSKIFTGMVWPAEDADGA
ncbi:MAG: 4'-phosphopantetheinyl transferase superfamily protein [Planctomycetes bacterium]|nr:4'-phosphopantetheinyl transferase superfamily protein [Planctomycetota bacterium]